ncbi:MAG: arginine--tRNA ligase [Bacteroidia bacterium]|nr:arginine--tRNA ligase [Bacteroidia bacterium]
MRIEVELELQILRVLEAEFGKIDPRHVQLQKTKPEFTGDFTLVCFPFTKLSGKKPDETAELIGAKLLEKLPDLESFQVVKGFLNISLSTTYWYRFLKGFGVQQQAAVGEKVMIEYSSPNTNKPLHLGHVRNILLGFSLSEILQQAGREVVKVNLVNDRGIHICKSMIAWQNANLNETPVQAGIKGDHLVGKYYVAFDKALQLETAPLLERVNSGDFSGFEGKTLQDLLGLTARLEKVSEPDKQKDIKSDIKLLVQSQTSLMKAARDMLQKWEAGDPEVMALWRKMNGWVYEGFEQTYKRLGVDFDRMYYESETWKLGREIVEKGLSDGHLYQKEDGSVWIDLTAEGLDHKVLLRSDGTTVYMTQDIGTAVLRHQQLKCKQYIYVVGNEQDYHFKALAMILKKLGYAWASGIYHLSYGMVDLPEGKMKSREGTVVDADDLMEEVVEEAARLSQELGKTDEMSEQARAELYETLGMGALKFYILKVDPRKRMVFNPKESIDLRGNTGPFIQYAYARICSLQRRASGLISASFSETLDYNEPAHRSMIRMLARFEEALEQAAETCSPALMANYAYELAKEFNQFYQTFTVLKEQDGHLAALRLEIARKTAEVLKQSMALLGINMPERM